MFLLVIIYILCIGAIAYPPLLIIAIPIAFLQTKAVLARRRELLVAEEILEDAQAEQNRIKAWKGWAR